MENSTKTENTIDLRRLWMLLRAHIWAIIAWVVGLGAVGFVLAAFVVEPKYTSTTQILVNQKRGETDANQAFNAQQADVQVINTYKDIVTSPVILKDASKWIKNPTEVVKPAKKAKYKTLADGTKKLVSPAEPAVVRRAGRGYNVSAKEMQKAVSVTTQQQSQVFTISAKSNDPEKAQAIANAVARTFKHKIKKIMNVNNVTIVSPASRGTKTFPRTSLFTLAGIILGLIISIALIVLRDSFNTTVRDDDYLTKELGLTNLGHVSHFHLSNDFSINKKDNDSSKKKRV
ncbi:YveK family protein [Lactobacillus johnsonii]|uniref:Capsular polysaccharide biosynthesis protein CpsC n=1 Tax=Lactobacillus johnsonii TaxID=33959 RepID=A0A9X0J616_LACJH|nr:Wzz/FepE/Etk N-terminal domain-containing protein [Lactobacillus johnsonii]KXN75625.1 exopolysaccharide biosynthesis protein [Lactobacillus johnsonii]MTE02976.1 exopolysaccharide biosynthesis protein [Lactobacillus johnsonii]